jgi:hypothetical protein
MSVVTAAERLFKQPGESRLYNFDFTALIVAGTTLDNAHVPTVTAVAVGNVANSSPLSVSQKAVLSPMVQVRLADGSDGEDYRVSVLTTDLLGNILEMDGIIKVRDA